MGEHNVNRAFASEKKSKFIRHLLNDIKALEFMLEADIIEKGITRIGAEQEFCLVTKDWRPAKNAPDILKEIDDPHFTTELARYNLEINLDPLTIGGNCFSEMERALTKHLLHASEISEKHKSRVLLAGILPTISKTHLSLDYITPNPRYYALNERLKELRRSNFQLHLQGVDELSVTHDSVLFEACNTSFQMHLQIDPDDFIASFNWAQAISGPVLGICSNSPLLLGRELWNETRIALFRQSIDTRNISIALKDQQPRVAFGNDWATGTAVNIFKSNISRYKIILDTDITENSLELVNTGEIPKLKAMNLHSGTIYPWNRACYGVGNGKAHLRIENRYIPAGPSVIDEMANFVLWAGIMLGRPKEFDDMSKMMDFRDAKSNFIKAARYGKDAMLHWRSKMMTLAQLVEKELLPMAYNGLKKAGIDNEDIDKYLGVIHARVRGNTGTEWQISNFRKLSKYMKKDSALRLITKSMHANQKHNLSVHAWSDADTDDRMLEASFWLGHIMSTQVFTVSEDDLASLATSIMEWNNIHHVPVEDKDGNLSGLLTWTHAEKFNAIDGGLETTVKEIMETKLITATTTTPIDEAIALMKKNEIGCLPVLQDDELVGIVTIHDVIAFDHDKITQ